MTESTGERAAPTTPPTKPPEADTCPDPIKPYTDYSVDVSVAAKRSELYTADKEKVDEKYGKVGDAQKRFADAWKEQKKPWESLKCQLERIEKALKLDPDEKKHLQECWTKEVAKTEKATEPINCDEINDDEKTNCEKLPTEIGELRRLEDLAANCVTRYDTEFDELAGFPEKLGDQITALTERATTLEDAMTASSDQRRSYVEYLALHRDFCKLKNQLPPTAADYACKLKVAFDIMLKTHKKSICLQVAVHKWDERQKLQEEAEKEKAGKLVDSVLECALKKPGHAGTSPEKPDEHRYESTPKPDHEVTEDTRQQGSETTEAGADC
jgi:hypothetical protein